MTLALAVAVSAVALAQGPASITLDQARERARTNTQALLAVTNRQNAEALVTAARAPLLPQVTASVSAGAQYYGSQTFIQAVPETSPTGEITWSQVAIDVDPSSRGSFGASLQVQQLLYDASRWAALAEAGAQEEAARGQEAEDRSTSELEAIRRFYELLKAQRTQQLLQERVKSSEELLERAKALFTAGRMKKEEEIAAAVNLGTDRMALLRQGSAVTAAQANLAVWLSRPPTDALLAQDPGTLSGEAHLALTYDQALEQARAHRPQLQAYSALVKAAHLGVASSSAGYLPSLSAFGRYDRSGVSISPFFTDPSKQNALSAGIAITWNAFSGFGTDAQVAQARAALSRAELTFAQAERDVGAELRRGISDLDSLSQVAALSKANLDLAKDGLTLAASRFDAGDTSTLQVRDAQVKLTQAEVSLLESRVDVEIARAALERSMGTLGSFAMKWWKIVIVVLVFLGTTGIAVSGLKSRPPPAVDVQFGKVKKGTITRTVTGGGKVQAATTVKISSNISGDLVELKVKAGDRVTKGQVLGRLDRRRFEAATKQAAAGQSASRADVSVAQVEVDRATAEYDRVEGLAKKGMMSATELERARADRDGAIARLAAARERSSQAGAAYDEAANQLSKTTLESPIDGTVIEVSREVGERVRGSDFNEDVVMTIAALAAMEVKLEVSEHEVVHLELGQKAEVRLDALEGQFFEGTVVEVAQKANVKNPGTDAEVTTFPVTVALTSRPPGVLPGMNAEVKITAATHNDALTVPIQAVTVRPDKSLPDAKAEVEKGTVLTVAKRAETLAKVVFVIDGDKKVHPKRVKTGISSDTDYEIVDGVGEGESIVEGPYRTLAKDIKDGDAVQEAQAGPKGPRS